MSGTNTISYIFLIQMMFVNGQHKHDMYIQKIYERMDDHKTKILNKHNI